MMEAEMASDPAQVHAIRVQLQGFAPHAFIIGPRFGFRRILDLTMHAAIALTAAAGFASSILSIRSLAFGTGDHALILAHFLATLRYPNKNLGAIFGYNSSMRYILGSHQPMIFLRGIGFSRLFSLSYCACCQKSS